MSPYKSKGIRSQWTEEDLKRAIRAVQNGESKNSASKQYKIPRRTLNRYMNKNTTAKQSLGRKSVLSEDQETELAARIIRLAQVGYPLTKRMLRRSVFNYCQLNGLSNKFSQERRLAGRHWLKAFLKRHPEITPRKAQIMNPARAQKLNKHIVSDYFEKLQTVLLELDLMDKPERIYNMDEKGCRLTLHHQQTILAKKGAKRVHLVAPEHAENVTVVACGNASGGRIPPAVLFKGQRMKREWCDNLPPGTLALMTKKASMTIETFNEWIRHFGKYKLPGNCLLIFDGASCHLDPSIVETADSHDITLLCLPSNTTHELQPMDKAVFKSFEHHWDEQVLLYWTRHRDRAITKQRFGELFTIVWDKAVTPQNIISGFPATGIYPYNPHAIPEVAFAPSILTERELVEDKNMEVISRLKENQDFRRETTPQPGPSGLQKRTYQSSIENTPPLKISNYPTKPKRQSKRKRSSSNSSSSTDDNMSLYSETLTETFSSEDEAPSDDEEATRSNVNKQETLKSSKIIAEAQKPMNYIQEPESTTNKHILHEILSKDNGHKKSEEQPKAEEDNTNTKNDEEEITLNTSFTEMLETPYKDFPKTTRKRKAINSKALIVKKEVFPTKTTKSTKAKEDIAKTKDQGGRTKHKESWYCKACQEDVKKDMRLCSVCSVYYHEECVGLTKADKTVFICSDCC